MEEGAQHERRERRDARRNMERVLQAAHELFAERGNDVTMEEVARRAGVGVGTIYRRFPNKEQLFAAVSHNACNDMRHCLHAVSIEERDPLAKLRALVLLQYHRCSHQAALLDLQPGPGLDEKRCITRNEQQQLYATMRTLVEQTIGEGQRQGLIRRGDPAVLAALCLELISPRSFRNLMLATGHSPEQLAEQVVQFVLGGLGVGVGGGSE